MECLHQRPSGIWLAALLVTVACGDVMSPQPIPTPAIETENLRLTVDPDDGYIYVSGAPGAIYPPESVVEVVNLSNLARVVTRADEWGAFGPVRVRGKAGDVIRVTVISTDPATAGDSEQVDVLARETPSGVAPGGEAPGGPGDAPDETPPEVVVPTLTCLVVKPERVVLPPAASNAALDDAERTAANSDDREATTAAADEPVIVVSNGCESAVAMTGVTIRPSDSPIAVRGDTARDIAPGERHKLTVAPRRPDAASLTAATPDVCALQLHFQMGAEADGSPIAFERTVMVVPHDDPTAVSPTTPSPRDAWSGADASSTPADTFAASADVRPRPREVTASLASDTVRVIDSATTTPDDRLANPRDTVSTERPDSAAQLVAIADVNTNTGWTGVTRTQADTSGAGKDVVAALADDVPAPEAGLTGAADADPTPVERAGCDNDRVDDVDALHELARRCAATDECLDATDVRCVVECLAGNGRPTEVAVTEVNLSDACNLCFAERAVCERDDCRDACVSMSIDLNCETNCYEERCAPAFEDCSGIDLTPRSDTTAPTNRSASPVPGS